VQETTADLTSLQALIERSIDAAGPFLRRSFEMPEHSLTAQQVVACLDGVPVVSFATVTAKGEPRVAPIGSLFWRGRFHIPTVMEAVRTRHVRQRPAVSLTWYDGTDRAVIVHGRASTLGVDHPDFATLDALHQQLTGASVTSWGDGAYLRVEADVLYSYTRHPIEA
jgi:hypothetical protein